jgi:hypothetical protein
MKARASKYYAISLQHLASKTAFEKMTCSAETARLGLAINSRFSVDKRYRI